MICVSKVPSIYTVGMIPKWNSLRCLQFWVMGKNVLNSDIRVDGNAFSGLMLNVLANHRKTDKVRS